MNSNEKDTGIYVQEPGKLLWSSSKPDDISAVKEAARRHNQMLDCDYLLAESEALAQQILDADRTDNWPEKVDREATVRDAKSLLADIRCARESSEPQLSAAWMFHVGRLHERLHVRFVEWFAVVGKRVVRGGQSAAARTHGEPEVRDAAKQDIYNYYLERLNCHGNVRGAKAKALRDTKEKFHCSETTVKRARRYFHNSSGHE